MTQSIVNRMLAGSVLGLSITGWSFTEGAAQQSAQRFYHPCASIVASTELDKDISLAAASSARLFVAAFGVSGDVHQTTITLLPEGEAKPAKQVITNDQGHVIIDSIRPGRYRIEVQGVLEERQEQRIRLLPGKTDTLCFTMRHRRFPDYDKVVPLRQDSIAQRTSHPGGQARVTKVSRLKGAG